MRPGSDRAHLAGAGLDEPAALVVCEDLVYGLDVDVCAVCLVLEAPEDAGDGGEVDDADDVVGQSGLELCRVADVAEDDLEVGAGVGAADSLELVAVEDEVVDGDGGAGGEEAGHDLLAWGVGG